MSLKDIKVGDTVLVNTFFHNGGFNRSRGRNFLIAEKVTKVTKAQFVAGDTRFRKDTGNAIGSGGMALLPGDKYMFGRIAQDQTEAANKYKKEVQLIKKAKDRVRAFEYAMNTASDHEKRVKITKQFLGIEDETN